VIVTFHSKSDKIIAAKATKSRGLGESVAAAIPGRRDADNDSHFKRGSFCSVIRQSHWHG
jgi:hypothetical protein